MRIVDFIVCDDIRYEIGNKHSLIGLYDDQIQFQVPIVERGKWPMFLKLGILLRAKFENELERLQVTKFRLESTLNGTTKLLAEGGFNFDPKVDAKGVNIAIVLNQFIFESPGTLSFRYTFLDNKNSIVQVFDSPDPIKVTEAVI